VNLKQLPAVRTIIWSTVTVHTTFVLLYEAGLAETLVTQWTLVWFLSRMNSHVSVQNSRITKRLVTQVTFVRFLSTVNSAVYNKGTWLCESFVTNSTFKRFVSNVNSAVYSKVTWCSKSFATNCTFKRFLSTVNSAVPHKVTWSCKSFATNSTFKRFLSWMTSPVYCQLTARLTTFATFCALVFTSMNIHMNKQTGMRWKTFVTLSTKIRFSTVTSFVNIQSSFSCISFVTHSTHKWLFSSVTSFVSIKTSSLCKPFVTHSTQIRPWLVITWMLSDIITTSCNLCLKGLRFISAISFSLNCLGILCTYTHTQLHNGHYTSQPVLADIHVWDLEDIVKQSSMMSLLMTNSTCGLGKICQSSPQQYYLHCLWYHTVFIPYPSTCRIQFW